jgi:maltose alpha-D-glucosyltransferase / alpha-amylase
MSAPTPAKERAKAVPTVHLAGDWETVWQGAAREALERQVLPAFLQAQRWFGGKARRVEAVRLADRADLPDGRTFLTLLTVAFADGTEDLYFLPLGVATGTAAARFEDALRPWAVARLTGPDGEAVLYDPLAADDACTALLDAIGAGREGPSRAGLIRGIPTTAFAELRGDPAVPLPVRRGPATSSNSLVFFGDRLLLKLFRRLEVGINPDFEIGRFLTEKSTFERVPKVAGTLEYHRPGEGPISLALLQAAVSNQGDGWRHALEELSRYFERASPRDPVAPDERPLPELADVALPPAAQETVGTYLQTAATLGRRTAELHVALAGDADDPAFRPEPWTAADAAALRDSIREQAEGALTALRDNLPRLPEAVAIPARRLLDEGLTALDRVRDVTAGGGAKIRCHGDYHLGQVLWVDNDFVILDFEGEPTRPVEERRAKQSPLKDVAGMLRSFHYAAYAGLFAFTKDRPWDFERLVPWAEWWYRWSAAGFLRAYHAAAGDAAFLPASRGDLAALLDSFMLEKAFYELSYELNNRPDWVRIPLRGILALRGRDRGAAPQGATP